MRSALAILALLAVHTAHAQQLGPCGDPNAPGPDYNVIDNFCPKAGDPAGDTNETFCYDRDIFSGGVQCTAGHSVQTMQELGEQYAGGKGWYISFSGGRPSAVTRFNGSNGDQCAGGSASRSVDILCAPPSCAPDILHSVTRTTSTQAFGSSTLQAAGSIGTCRYVQMAPGQDCAGQTLEELYAASPPRRLGVVGGGSALSYEVFFCSTGESVATPDPIPAVEKTPPDLQEDTNVQPADAPVEEVQQPSSSTDTTAVQSTTNPDGSVTETQTTTTTEDRGSGLGIYNGDGTLTIVEFANYDDGLTVTETTTETTYHDDGRIVETVTETVRETPPSSEQGSASHSGGEQVTRESGTTTITTTTTTTTTNPDGSESTTSSTTTGTDADGDGQPDDGGNGNADGDNDPSTGDGQGGGNGDGEGGGGEGEFKGSGFGEVRTFAESIEYVQALGEDPANIVGAVAGLADTIPSGGTCPTASFDVVYLGAHTIDAHCDYPTIYNILRLAFLAGWAIAFVLIILEV